MAPHTHRARLIINLLERQKALNSPRCGRKHHQDLLQWKGFNMTRLELLCQTVWGAQVDSKTNDKRWEFREFRVFNNLFLFWVKLRASCRVQKELMSELHILSWRETREWIWLRYLLPNPLLRKVWALMECWSYARETNWWSRSWCQIILVYGRDREPSDGEAYRNIAGIVGIKWGNR